MGRVLTNPIPLPLMESTMVRDRLIIRVMCCTSVSVILRAGRTTAGTRWAGFLEVAVGHRSEGVRNLLRRLDYDFGCRRHSTMVRATGPLASGI
jgi:hypothetical protein